MTTAERKLWVWLSSNLSYPVLRQRPIDNYIVDFYCPKQSLVIEVDGESHETSDAREYDQVRDAILEGYDLRVLRLRNHEVLYNFDLAIQKIQSCLRK
jgi:very-short-patch-repair endonuclease